MADAITLEKSGQRIYFRGNTYPAKDTIKAMGATWDKDARAWWIGVAKEDEATVLVARLNEGTGEVLPSAKEDPDSIRLVGKATYKGRTYFIRAISRGRCRLVSLDQSRDFWVDAEQATIVKHYQPREYRGRTEYTTLGSIKRFIEKDKKESDGAVCAECGRGGSLVEDLEDGLMKHRRCCDIPPG